MLANYLLQLFQLGFAGIQYEYIAGPRLEAGYSYLVGAGGELFNALKFYVAHIAIHGGTDENLYFINVNFAAAVAVLSLLYILRKETVMQQMNFQPL